MKEYTVIYEWAGTNNSAYVPDLPGCVACGDTLEETEQLMRQAIELYIEALKAEGRAISEPRTKAGPMAVTV
jgi:predicted RNase H-like HicB family nuclease